VSDSRREDPTVRRGSGVWEQESKKEDDVKPAPEAQPSARLKLAASLRDLTSGRASTKIQAAAVSQGKITVKIWLTDASAQAIQKLKDAGLQVIVQNQTRKMVIGRVDVKKLLELAQINFVTLIEPSKIRK
jgi:hypothetical protein